MNDSKKTKKDIQKHQQGNKEKTKKNKKKPNN